MPSHTDSTAKFPNGELATSEFAACAIGVSVMGHMMEVCAMAPLGDVVLHGWFPKAAALKILGNRPPCHIAFAGEPLPNDVIDGFNARGHAAIIMSKRGLARTVRTGRAAADICRVALSYAAAEVQPVRLAS
jgi:hypothetical protein